MEATMAYQAGKPIVTDEEYDQLKRELRNKNSMVVQQVQIPRLPLWNPFMDMCQPSQSLTAQVFFPLLPAKAVPGIDCW